LAAGFAISVIGSPFVFRAALLLFVFGIRAQLGWSGLVVGLAISVMGPPVG
jgi:hypothetical protein